MTDLTKEEDQMTIMETKKQDASAPEDKKNVPKGVSEEKTHKENAFSDKNVSTTSEIPANEVSSGNMLGLSSSKRDKPLVITSRDKLAFLDSVVNNTRFTKDYSIFGGKVRFTVRSLTAEEVQALYAWILKMGTSDPTGQIAGRYRKHALAAQIAKFNDTEMLPLCAPLFTVIGKDGKIEKEPGWVDQGSFWDDKPSGVLQAIFSCLKDFDDIYATLCTKAEDTNFWNPDTP